MSHASNKALGNALMKAPRSWPQAGLIAGACIALLAAGCSGQPGALKHGVSGTVSLAGRPMPDGEVYFRMPATGAIEVFAVKAGAFRGVAVAGRHRVEIYRFEQPKPTPAEVEKMDPMARALANEKKNLLPAEYNTRSTLEADVQPGQANRFDFALGGPG
jgi:hypothetical protein